MPAFNSELEGGILMSDFCQQEANTIDAMKARDNPLLGALLPFHHCPNMVFVVVKSQLQVLPKGF